MDFNENDELDYEEDYFENDSGSKNATEDETNENSDILRSGEPYIQINIPEEEENLSERIVMGSEQHPDTQDVKKNDEKIQKMEQDKPPSEKQNCSENNINNNNNSRRSCNNNDENNINYRAKKIFKKNERPFQSRFKMKKLPTNTLTLGSLLPQWNFSSAYDFSAFVRESVNNSQILNLSQNYYSSPHSQLSLLGLAASQLSQNPPQLISMGDRGLRHEIVKPKAIMRNKNIKNKQNFNIRGLADNNQICEAKKNSKNWTPQHQSGKSVDTDKLNCFGENNNDFLNALCSPLKDDEKQLVKLKKEARLKRFMNDDVVREEKKSISLSESKIKDSLNLGTEYLQKLQEQKFLREKLLSLKELQRKNLNLDIDGSVSMEKTEINKEALLKKKNPFSENLEKSDCFLMNKVKQEKEKHEEVKQESFERGLHFSQGLNVVKSEMNPPVKFIRTISKSFDELAIRKAKTEVSENKEDKSLFSKAFLSSRLRRLPSVETNETNYSNTNEPPTQTDIQLIGCIVKVFNIPPSTTTNDILALCRPIGIVKEMKLNLPKENSVVIRFEKPTSAENFFSVYHGQKMNNYFLNVIVI